MAVTAVQTEAQAMETAAARTHHIHSRNTTAARTRQAHSHSTHDCARTAPASLAGACSLSYARARFSPRATTARGASHRARRDAATDPRRQATTTQGSWRTPRPAAQTARQSDPTPSPAVIAPGRATPPAAETTRPSPRRTATHRPRPPRPARSRTRPASTTQRHAPLHLVRRARTQPRQLV